MLKQILPIRFAIVAFTLLSVSMTNATGANYCENFFGRSAKASLAHIDSFDNSSIALVDPWISFSSAEIENTLHVLINPGHIDKTQAGFNMDANGKLQEVIWTTSAGLLPSVTDKLQAFSDDLINFYIRIKGVYPSKVGITIRATSDNLGHSVTKKYGGNTLGLHNHVPRKNSPLKRKVSGIDFVWALKGLGPKILRNGRIEQIENDKIALFGEEVMHGSPDSQELRLIVVGSVSE